MDYLKLHKLVEVNKISIRGMCKTIGITPSTYYNNIENENLKVSHLEKMCAVLNIDITIFFTKDGLPAPSNSGWVTTDANVSFGQRDSANTELLKAYKRITELQDELASYKDTSKAFKKINSKK